MATYGALLDEIANRLVAQGLGGLPGTTQATNTGYTITKAFQQPTTGKLIVIYPTGGRPNPALSTGTLDEPTFAVHVRSSAFGYAAAETKLQAIREALDIGRMTLTNWVWAGIRPLHPPLSLTLNNQHRPTATF